MQCRSLSDDFHANRVGFDGGGMHDQQKYTYTRTLAEKAEPRAQNDGNAVLNEERGLANLLNLVTL
jgi:hypothetical protein